MGVCRPGFQLAERSGADLAIQLFSEKPISDIVLFQYEN